ncbi:MAG: hypothetical protein FJW95_09030 [Actinobacteria bacterium]|nr:hypothetical protein [Actinomycetota bacterium]
MSKNPDPTIALTNLAGTTRTLDDWTTMFHMVLVVLPDRLEGAQYVPIAERIFAVFGDSDAKVGFLVPGPAPMADRLLERARGPVNVFLDPDRALIASLGLEHLPALVHLRQNATLANVAEGWDPKEWQMVAKAIGKAMAWTFPEVARAGDPPATAGWPALLA